MTRFLVLYLCPTNVLDDWMKTPEEERKATESKMQEDWQEWASAHKSALHETAGAGRPTRVTKDGAVETRNEIMMFSIVETADLDAAKAMFIGHPHLGIPEASIEIMQINTMPDMA